MFSKPLLIASLLSLSVLGCSDDTTGTIDAVTDTMDGADQAGDTDLEEGTVEPGGLSVVAAPMPAAGSVSNRRFYARSGVLAGTPPGARSHRFTLIPLAGARR